MLAVSSLPSLPFYRKLTQPISYGTAVEHHSLFQYQISNTHSIFAGFIQTETPYYQPIPDAKHSPYPSSTALNDPTFSNCPASGNCDAWVFASRTVRTSLFTVWDFTTSSIAIALRALIWAGQRTVRALLRTWRVVGTCLCII
jgi:hypothetical protein